MPEFTEASAADTAVETTTESTNESFAPTEEISSAPDVETGDALDALPDEAPVYANFNPEVLPEEARPVYSALHSDFEAAQQFKSEAEPLITWVNEIGGKEAIERDLQIFDAAFSEDPDQRANFHNAFYESSPSAYARFVGDILQSEYGQQQVLHSLGLNPALLDTYRQVAEDGTLDGQPVAAEPVAEPEFLAGMPQDLRDLFKTFPREVQEDYALQAPGVAKFHLENAYHAHRERQRQDQERQVQQQREAQERQHRIAQAQQQTYQETRKIVTESLKQAFEGDDLLPELVASAVETEYFDSPEGQAQWLRLSDLIAKGESRAVKAELPLVIAQVKAIAAKKSEKLAQIYADARKWRAQQQKENPRTEIGGGDPAGTTRTISPANGAGQYRPENILQYWEQGARR